MSGTKELKDVLDLLVAGVESGVKVAADGQVGVSDLVIALELVKTLPAAVSGIGEVPAELSDLDEAEAAELVAHVVAKLAVDDAKAKAVIGASLKVLVAGHGLYKAISA